MFSGWFKFITFIVPFISIITTSALPQVIRHESQRLGIPGLEKWSHRANRCPPNGVNTENHNLLEQRHHIWKLGMNRWWGKETWNATELKEAPGRKVWGFKTPGDPVLAGSLNIFVSFTSRSLTRSSEWVSEKCLCLAGRGGKSHFEIRWNTLLLTRVAFRRN